MFTQVFPRLSAARLINLVPRSPQSRVAYA